MPYNCVVCGRVDKQGSSCEAENEENKENPNIALHRFPLKQQCLLDQWEHAVQKVHKDGKQWRATRYTYICSRHFDVQDYQELPSSSGKGHLKRGAVPSIFPIPIKENYNIPKEAQNRLQPQDDEAGCSRKRHLGKVDIPTKVKRAKEDAEDIPKKKLKNKIKILQQQLRRSQKKIQTMSELIDKLQEDLVIKTEIADHLHSTFDKLQLSLFYNIKNNNSTSPNGRRYTDDIKQFALTLHFYSPKAYQYVRSILPLPNPSLIRKWGSSVKCEPGFLDEAFQSLAKEVSESPIKKDCCLVIDAMSIRKQTIWEPKKDQYSGFINYGAIPVEEPDTLASEALVFLLVGTRSHWKCPIGYFLCDKMTAGVQAKLVTTALELAADNGLRVWSVTSDGTSVNISMFRQLGCKFGTSYDAFETKFKHPSQDYYVYAILDACHMLKLARNALASLSTFVTTNGEKIKWQFFSNLYTRQENEGLKLGNKLSLQHIQYTKHKMNVRLAAQTLSSSVADAIAFLNTKMNEPMFEGSEATVTFTRNIDRLFDMLNSRNPAGKGYKQPLRQRSRSVWEPILKSTAEYLLGLSTDDESPQLLAAHRRKTFILGFVTSIKSTIEMVDEMFSNADNPFKYLLTYKFSQDHIEQYYCHAYDLEEDGTIIPTVYSSNTV